MFNESSFYGFSKIHENNIPLEPTGIFHGFLMNKYCYLFNPLFFCRWTALGPGALDVYFMRFLRQTLYYTYTQGRRIITILKKYDWLTQDFGS